MNQLNYAPSKLFLIELVGDHSNGRNVVLVTLFYLIICYGGKCVFNSPRGYGFLLQRQCLVASGGILPVL